MGSAAACHSTKAKHCVKTKWSVNPNKLWVVSSITLIGPGFELPLEYHYCIMEGCEQEACERGKSVKTHCGYRHFTLENKYAHSHTLACTWLKTCVYYLELDSKINLMTYGNCSICGTGYTVLQV